MERRQVSLTKKINVHYIVCYRAVLRHRPRTHTHTHKIEDEEEGNNKTKEKRKH